MSKGVSFQALQYTLIIRDATGAKITGTGSIYDLEKTRTFAASIFQVNRRAAFIDIHPYIEGGSYTGTALETVHRSGIAVAAIPPIPAKEEPEPSEDQVEAAAEVPVEKTPVESSPAPRRRDRRGGKAKQEEP